MSDIHDPLEWSARRPRIGDVLAHCTIAFCTAAILTMLIVWGGR